MLHSGLVGRGNASIFGSLGLVHEDTLDSHADLAGVEHRRAENALKNQRSFSAMVIRDVLMCAHDA